MGKYVHIVPPDNKQVPDPDTNSFLVPVGKLIDLKEGPNAGYWRRRIANGEVEVMEPKKPKTTKKVK